MLFNFWKIEFGLSKSTVHYVSVIKIFLENWIQSIFIPRTRNWYVIRFSSPLFELSKTQTLPSSRLEHGLPYVQRYILTQIKQSLKSSLLTWLVEIHVQVLQTCYKFYIPISMDIQNRWWYIHRNFSRREKMKYKLLTYTHWSANSTIKGL